MLELSKYVDSLITRIPTRSSCSGSTTRRLPRWVQHCACRARWYAELITRLVQLLTRAAVMSNDMAMMDRGAAAGETIVRARRPRRQSPAAALRGHQPLVSGDGAGQPRPIVSSRRRQLNIKQVSPPTTTPPSCRAAAATPGRFALSRGGHGRFANLRGAEDRRDAGGPRLAPQPTMRGVVRTQVTMARRLRRSAGQAANVHASRG